MDYTNPATTDWFNFNLDDDFSKLDNSMSMSGMGMNGAAAPAPYDFFAGFNPNAFGAAGSFSSPESISAGTSFGGSQSDAAAAQQSFSIDPQLVGTPSAASPAELSSHHSNNDDDKMSDGEDDEEEAESQKPELESEPVIAPVKVGGRGKAGRRGTVQSGGIAKKTPPLSSVVRVTGGTAPNSTSVNVSVKKAVAPVEKVAAATKREKDEDDDENDDWRPSPEEYKKMSSKEKRQLRNKISARNFRVRRKGMFAVSLTSTFGVPFAFYDSRAHQYCFY